MINLSRFKKRNPVLYFVIIALILTLCIFFYIGFSRLSYYIAISAITFLFYGYDKICSKIPDVWRVPEMALHILSLIGGFAGAFAGRIIFRHKTQKKIFLAVIIISILIHAMIYFCF